MVMVEIKNKEIEKIEKKGNRKPDLEINEDFNSLKKERNNRFVDEDRGILLE